MTRIGQSPIPQTPIEVKKVKDQQKADIANSGVKTDDAIVTNEQGQLNQADLQGAIETSDTIYLQTEAGGDEFVEMDLTDPANRSEVEQMLADLENGQDVSLDTQTTTLIQNEVEDPNPEINLKDGENTLKDLKEMGIDVKDGISQEEGQQIIDNLQAEGASKKDIKKVQAQIQEKLNKNEKLKLDMNPETGAYSFDFATSEEEKVKSGHWSTKTVKVSKGKSRSSSKRARRHYRKNAGKCPGKGRKKIFNNKSAKYMKVPKWNPPSFKTNTTHVEGVTGDLTTKEVENNSFQLKKAPIPEPYEFDFPNLYQNNKTAIEDKDKFKQETVKDNAIFEQIVENNEDLNIVIKAEGSRNVDRPDWKSEYTSEELQDQRAIKGSYAHDDNTFVVTGTASAAPGSGTYRPKDVPAFARNIVKPRESAVHNDTLSLFRSINAYVEFVDNASPETRDAVKDKKVQFELNPQVREHLQAEYPELLEKLDAGLSWQDMVTYTVENIPTF